MVKNKGVTMSDLELEKRQNEERRQQEDRREIRQLRDENEELRKENRRLLEDRRGGGGNFWGILFVLSLVVFVGALLFRFETQLYPILVDFPNNNSTSDQYIFMRMLKHWSPVANFSLITSGVFVAVSWFLKKK